MAMKYELMDMSNEHAVIKVIGVGGGGGNAVSHMVAVLWRALSLSVRIPMRRH
jgi:cell division protein FtsZ